MDAGWLEDELAELEHLVEDGDTLGLVSRLSRTVGAPVRAGVGAPIADRSYRA